MSKLDKPKFLSSIPSGQDLFPGKSHEKTANTIFELIGDRAFPNNVIGLEGNWGSGKSNVIKILSDRFQASDADYSFFTYDAWAHQEDITRRTFLEELITQLQEEEKFKDKVDWGKELEKLLARSTTSTVEKFPKIKFYWIVIMGSLLLFALLDKIFTDFFQPIDLIKDFDARYFKLFLFKYLFPIGIFLWGLWEMRKEYKAFDNEEKTKGLDWKKRLKILFYIFSGKDLTSEEHSHIIEKEPSVKRFKEYFSKITDDLNNDGIIIVFDNMDRLNDSTKVQSLWSSIYTFFAEEKIENVWVIIPFDRKHLAKHFKAEKEAPNSEFDTIDNFLGKTFSTVFRIAPPVLSDWKLFFHLKFTDAFSDKIETETVDFISTLFELIISADKKNPRDIITFLNNLVALYLQHPETIKIKYLALFALRKEEILKNPLVQISSKGFFNGEGYLFDDIEELEESLGAIVYNVEKDKANEILLKNSIEELIYKGDLDLLKNIKGHTEFPHYFNNILSNNGLDKRNPETVVSILTNVEDVIDSATLKRHWINFANVVTQNTREETKFEEWHKTAMLKVSKKWAGEIAQKLISQAHWELRKSVTQQSYYSLLDEIFSFLKTNKRNVTISTPLATFDADQFLGYIDDMQDKFLEGTSTFRDFNIRCNQEDIENFFLVKETEVISKIYQYRVSLAFLKQNQKHTFSKLKEKIQREVNSITYDKKEEINKLVEINKVFFSHEIWPRFSENTGITYLTQNNSKEPAYPAVVASQLNFLSNSPAHPQFVQFLDNAQLADEVAPIVQNYLSLADIFQLFFQKNKKNVLIKNIICLVIKNSYGFKSVLDAEWVIKNLHQIKTSLYQESFNEFLIYFDQWEEDFSLLKGKQTTFFDEEIIKMTFDADLHEYKAIGKVFETVINDMRSLSSERWVTAFEKKDIYYLGLEGYLQHSILDSSVSTGKEFMEAYKTYFYKIAHRELSVPQKDVLWDKLLSDGYLNLGKISRIYNDILDYLLDHSKLETAEIDFFIGGIMTYAGNIKMESKADDLIRKLILPLDSTLNLLADISSKYKDSLIEIINSSTHQYDQDLIDLLQQGLEKEILDSELVEEIISKASIKTERSSVSKEKL